MGLNFSELLVFFLLFFSQQRFLYFHDCAGYRKPVLLQSQHLSNYIYSLGSRSSPAVKILSLHREFRAGNPHMLWIFNSAHHPAQTREELGYVLVGLPIFSLKTYSNFGNELVALAALWHAYCRCFLKLRLALAINRKHLTAGLEMTICPPTSNFRIFFLLIHHGDPGSARTLPLILSTFFGCLEKPLIVASSEEERTSSPVVPLLLRCPFCGPHPSRTSEYFLRGNS